MIMFALAPLSWCVVLLILSSLGPLLPSRKIKKINHFFFLCLRCDCMFLFSIFWCCINSKLPKRDLGVKVSKTCPKNNKMAKRKFPPTKICVHMWQKLDILEKLKKIQEFIFQNLAKFWLKIMKNVDRNIFIFGISKRIAQKKVATINQP
jgi:hypothetical protein